MYNIQFHVGGRTGRGQRITLTRISMYFIILFNVFHGSSGSCSQLDNNNFGGNSIPRSYANMSKLIKL